VGIHDRHQVQKAFLKWDVDDVGGANTLRKRARSTDGSRDLLGAEYPKHVWAIDFKFDQTMDGRNLKFMNVIDEYNRICLAIRVGQRWRAFEMIDTIEKLVNLYRPPTNLRMDNRHQFFAHALQE
jgi:putative transposase